MGGHHFLYDSPDYTQTLKKLSNIVDTYGYWAIFKNHMIQMKSDESVMYSRGLSPDDNGMGFLYNKNSRGEQFPIDYIGVAGEVFLSARIIYHFCNESYIELQSHHPTHVAIKMLYRDISLHLENPISVPKLDKYLFRKLVFNPKTRKLEDLTCLHISTLC